MASFRCLARLSKSLYGSSVLEKTEVDHWLTFTLGPLSCPGEIEKSLSYLDSVLQPATFLVGDSVTIADYEVYGKLANMPVWLWMEVGPCDCTTSGVPGPHAAATARVD